MPSRLKSLELLGYKTFAAKTQFAFGEKITAIVGPNGSGKSNVADSIRWVLGEQSFSLLRGKKTEDMIFAGSEVRPRASMAQATVTFDNADGWLPIDFSEVSITRRAYRDGQNEYLLNGQRTRLRDIAELLGKVGLAERTYTVVGQGLVDSALSLKAEERRALFEEAAGIGIYRAKREETLRKLDQTQRNLERVHDILAEIRPRLRALERQAQRAREYNQVKAELDGVLKIWYGYHWHETQKAITTARRNAEFRSETLAALQGDQQAYDRSLANLRAKISALRAQLHTWGRDATRLRAEAEILNRSLAVADERLRSFAEQRQSLISDLQSLETDLAAQTELADSARAELAKLEAEHDAARAQLESLEAARARRETERQSLADRALEARERAAQLAAQLAERQAHRAQLASQRERLIASRAEQTETLARAEAVVAEKQTIAARLNAQAVIARARYDEAEATLNDLAARIADADAELAATAAQLAEAIAAEGKLIARAEVLAQIRAGLGGDDSGLTRLRQAAQQNQLAIRAELADIINTPPELDVAITAALGQFLNAILLDEPEAALDLLAGAEGRAAILTPARLRPSPLPLPDQPHPDVLGLASNLVTCNPEHRPLVESLLARVIVVRARHMAIQVATHLPAGAAAITLNGEIFFANGAVIGGRDSAAATLALAREQRNLPAEIEQARQQREQHERNRDAQDSAVRQLRTDLATATAGRRDLQTAGRAADDARAAAQLDLDRANSQAQLHRDQVTNYQLQLSQLDSDSAARAAELDGLAVSAKEADEAARAAASHTFELTSGDLAEKIAGWQTSAAVATRAAADAKTRLDEMQTGLDRAAEALAARQARIAALNANAENFLASLESDRATLSNLQSLISNLQSQIDPAEKQLAALETELTGAEATEAGARAELHAAEHHHAEAQLDYARKRDELETLRRHITDDFGLVALEYTDDMAGPTPLPLEGIVEHLPQVDALPEGMEDLLNRRRAQLRRMGAINPDALNEFNEVKERNEFLTVQVADLESAAAQLREVIAELDMLMEREFRKTFDAVAEQFKDTFSRLFGGGTARLLLTEPENLTNSGIDILARLPGRKQQGLALLSGGERALTASALIFALLKVNPPPFAMLDEVDAALDEANVGRFRDLLVELSRATQFVVITHNRSTVQAADTVYGISMGADSASQAISLKLDGETVVKG